MTREKIISNLKYTMEKHKNDVVNTFDTNISLMCKDILDYLEQEPNTGHWILDETDNSITCDKCGCLIWANDISNGEAYYCPNCGARMQEGEEI